MAMAMAMALELALAIVLALALVLAIAMVVVAAMALAMPLNAYEYETQNKNDMTTHELLYTLACMTLPFTMAAYCLPSMLRKAREERQRKDAEQWKRERL